METKILKAVTKDGSINDETFKECADIIKRGGLVAFPTETVYGLGGNAFEADVSKKIYAAKGRPSDNPLIVHIAKIEDLYKVASYVTEYAIKLAEKYWPGPLTMILKKSDIVPDETTGGLDTVAVRMPSHIGALKLIEVSGVPIAAPSANASGRPSPTIAEHVVQDLAGKIDAVIDGGAVDIGLESTIVDVSTETPVLLRPGYITTEMIENVIGKIQRDPTLDKGVTDGIRPKAPGMMYRHYAPQGEMTIVSGKTAKVIEKINEFVKKHDFNETAVITTEENKELYNDCRVFCMGKRTDEESVAKQLYAVLRKMDDNNIKNIYVESFADGELSDAIMNRLIKAAGYKIVAV